MATVRKILEKKGTQPLTISASVTVFDALKEMVEKNVGSLIVMDGPVFLGLFSERDYARKVMLQGRTSRTTFLHEILDEDCVTVESTASIPDCMKLMIDNSIRYLPVVESGTLGGIISIGDVVKFIIDEQQFTLDQLQHYITDTR